MTAVIGGDCIKMSVVGVYVRPWLIALSACAFLLTACGDQPSQTGDPKRVLESVGFDALDDWHADDQRAALGAFLKSCPRLNAARPDAPFSGLDVAGPVGLWLEICAQAALLDVDDQTAARLFFEKNFAVYRVSADGDAQGLFTGYFEPELAGSLERGADYQIPLHRVPDDLVTIELGGFVGDWEGKRLIGRLDHSQFVPYYSRAEIDAGALAARDLELLWVDDLIDKFFLQIQGSGRVQLDDGRILRVGYAGQNGHPYRAIGRDLIEQGEIAREDVSLETIDAWLREHVGKALAMMHNNPSYVFFRLQDDIGADDGPLGAQSVALTAGRSLAVDRAFMPLGAPVWLESTMPVGGEDVPLRRLMVAQDTGGAIKGPVRGDVFWGAGDVAKSIAGAMKAKGRYFLFLPRSMGRSS